jgi:hypothetical protein
MLVLGGQMRGIRYSIGIELPFSGLPAQVMGI